MRDDDDLIGDVTDTKEVPLHKVLSDNLPEEFHNTGRYVELNMARLGEEIGLSRESIRQWVKKNRIQAKWVGPLCTIKGGTLTKQKLLDYIDFG